MFCNNKYILYINNFFLKKNEYTDTITFNYSNDINIIYGDMYINIDQIIFNSIKYKQKLEIEYKRVIIHSLLHLIGYNDKNLIEKNKIKLKENFYIYKYNFNILKL
ncbi:MAG: rRNA maturation RNase YbeY [Candidatus Shikimatogenerans bostrichidophilus]|nr:MAG: rRNA maturation RNase YbeY [Candidatus Shikimatogenerans bostrichidophilus]